MKISEEILSKIRSHYNETGELSVCYIMRKFRLSPSMAKEAIDYIKPVSHTKIKNAYRKLANKLITKMFSMS